MWHPLRSLLSRLALLSCLAAPAAAQLVECLEPGNHMVNCGFDTDVSGWNLSWGSFAHQPGDGFPQAGSLEAQSVTTPTNAVIEFEQLVPVLAPASSYDYSLDVRVISGAADECALTLVVNGSHLIQWAFYPGAGWSRVNARAQPAAVGSFATFKATCFNYASQPFAMRFDDAYLAPTVWTPDVSVALVSCQGTLALGGGVAYGALVENHDATRPADVDLVASLPGTCRWACAPTAGAFCTTGPVQGPLTDAVYLPAGGSVSYDVTCLDATGPDATLTATVLGGSDPNPADNVDTHWHAVVPAAQAPHVKGDLTGDMQVDLVLRQQGTWTHALWEQVGARRLGAAAAITPTPDPAWELEGVDDFDGDHRSDLVFRHATSGAVEFWLMNGLARVGAPVPLGNAPTLPLDWQLAVTGDFDRDGWPDLLWRTTATQKLAVWTLNGTDRAGVLVPSPDQAVHPNWDVVAALDYDGDQLRDLLWYNSTSGRIVLWLMDASLARRTGFFTNPPGAGDNNWKVLASGDYGIGPAGRTCANDLVWRNANSGKLVLWYMDRAGNRTSGTFVSPAAPSPDPLGWTLVGPR